MTNAENENRVATDRPGESTGKLDVVTRLISDFSREREIELAEFQASELALLILERLDSSAERQA